MEISVVGKTRQNRVADKMASKFPLNLARQLTHKQRVTRLYRQMSRHLLSWAMERHIWREQAVLLRARFDENKHLTDKKKIAEIMKDAEEQFRLYRHPMPYIHPCAPGGSKYERNAPFEEKHLQMLPMEEEWYKEMDDWANGRTN